MVNKINIKQIWVIVIVIIVLIIIAIAPRLRNGSYTSFADIFDK